MVRVHPCIGRKCLYLGDHAESIVGMSYGDGRALVEEPNVLAIHPDLSYHHRWRAHQTIVWDIRCLSHRATACDVSTQKRVVLRCTVLGEVPVRSAGEE